ncbi:MAG: hypothetical protein ACOC1F_13295 [Myxococcota bacterium]
MSDVSFTQALRAELDAVVARYEAMVQAHQQNMAASYERDTKALRAELDTLRRERDQLERRASEAERQHAKLDAALEQRDQEIASLRESVDRERKRTNEASSRAAESLAEARMKIGELNAELDLVADESRVFEEVFAGEVGFAEACMEVEGTRLFDAVCEAIGERVAMTPAVYGALKRERLDVVLTRTVRERSRSALEHPLSDVEHEALANMAQAAGCELIEPALGARFEADAMDKIATAPDPAEEGNVLACLMPGLRLAGSEGALAFPKVKVAVG